MRCPGFMVARKIGAVFRHPAAGGWCRLKKAGAMLLAVLTVLAGCSSLLDPGRDNGEGERSGQGTGSNSLRVRMVGTWVRPIRVQQGAIEGMRFDEDGIFGFIGIHTMNGLAWRIESETLILETNSTRYAQPFESSLSVVMLSDETLVLAGKDYLSGTFRRDDSAGARITGTVNCRKCPDLEEDAFVSLSLLDVSLEDAPAGFVADQNMPATGRQMPIPFHLYYATADIDPGHTYEVRADIIVAGKRRFTTARAYPVITRGNPSTVAVEVVRLAGQAGAEGRASEGDTVSEPAPAAAGDRVLLAGMFSYMADAALFVECRTGRRFPVAMERDYLALERAYLGTEHEPGQAIFVTVEGRFSQRQKMEGEGREEMLIVERFISIVPGEDCKPVETATSLENTYWRLVEVGGMRVAHRSGQEDPHMRLMPGEGKVQGFTGCNNFFGGYLLEGRMLSFSAIGSTRMACPEDPEVEQGFLGALHAATSYRIHGEILELLRDSGVIARFESENRR